MFKASTISLYSIGSSIIILFFLFLNHNVRCGQGLGYSIVGNVTPDPIHDLDASISRLKGPTGVCFDPRNGDMYICDTVLKKIIKVDNITNKASWFAGNGYQYACSKNMGTCNHGGDKKDAGFSPNQCVVDPFNSDLYFTDTGSMIRKIDASTGILTLIAGGDTNGVAVNGTSAFNALLSGTVGIAIDSNYIYFSEQNNYCIRKVDKKSLILYTHAGICGTSGYLDSSNAFTAKFTSPRGIVLANDGTIYVADGTAHTIRKITSSGIVSTFAGVQSSSCSAITASPACGDNSVRTLAKFNQPYSLTLDSNNNLYILDMNTFRIRKIDAITNIVSTVVGTGIAASERTGPNGDGQLGSQVKVNFNSGCSITYYGNKIYFTDKSALNSVRQYDLQVEL